MPRSSGGYTFHMGEKKFGDHFTYIDSLCVKLGTTRSRLITAMLLRVCEERMIEDLVSSRVERLGSPPKSKPEYLPMLLPRSRNLLDQTVVDETSEQPPRSDLPEPSRRVPIPPLPDSRPKIFTTRPGAPGRREPEKSKDRLREELRQAVENTR